MLQTAKGTPTQEAGNSLILKSRQAFSFALKIQEPATLSILDHSVTVLTS